MDIKTEDFEEAKQRFMKQQELNIEFSNKEIEYRKLTSENNLNLSIDWEDDIEKVNKHFLTSKIEIEGLEDLEENFTVVYLNLSRILDYHCRTAKQANKTYPKNKLWDTCRSDRKITKLISHIKEGRSVCPPVIDFTFVELTKTEVFALYDGNHRIALSRFLGLDSIPFLVRKTNVDRIKNI